MLEVPQHTVVRLEVKLTVRDARATLSQSFTLHGSTADHKHLVGICLPVSVVVKVGRIVVRIIVTVSVAQSLFS